MAQSAQATALRLKYPVEYEAAFKRSEDLKKEISKMRLRRAAKSN